MIITKKRLKRSIGWLFCFLIPLAAAFSAGAAAPSFIPIQGILEDAEGTPIDGSVNIHFAIYDAEIEGERLWYETQNILVQEGLFTAYLGEVEALDLTLFRDNTNLWLGAQVESDEEMDRLYFGSTPYSAFAQYCAVIPDHTHDFAHIEGVLPDTALPGGVAVGPQTCTGGDKVVGLDMSGMLVCADDDDTTYLAGSGLTLTGRSFSVNPAEVQTRVEDACAAGSAIRAISQSGGVTCEPDDDALAGLGCDNGEVAMRSDGAWGCGSPGSTCATVSTYGDTTCYLASSSFASSRGYSWCTTVAAYPNAGSHQGIFRDSSCSAAAYGSGNSQEWWCVNYALRGGSGSCYGSTYYVGANVFLLCCR